MAQQPPAGAVDAADQLDVNCGRSRRDLVALVGLMARSIPSISPAELMGGCGCRSDDLGAERTGVVEAEVQDVGVVQPVGG
jgi:hypothetical protein